MIVRKKKIRKRRERERRRKGKWRRRMEWQLEPIQAFLFRGQVGNYPLRQKRKLRPRGRSSPRL
jgi:hypothetical protein